MIIVGLGSSEVLELQQEAYIQAQKWILSNWKAYNKTNAMFEKVTCRICMYLTEM